MPVPSSSLCTPELGWVGDLQAIKCFVSELTDDGGGFLECVSLSHKSRGYGNALGLEMSLVALAKGVSNVSWARVWLDVAKQSECLLEGAPQGCKYCSSPLLVASGQGFQSGIVLSQSG